MLVVAHRRAVVHITRNGGRERRVCYLLDQFICNVTFDSQLPNLRGQACESMGKSSRCMGHSAWMVNLRTEQSGFSITQGCFCRHKSQRPAFWILPACLRGETGWGGERQRDFLPPVTTAGREQSADWQQREIHVSHLCHNRGDTIKLGDSHICNIYKLLTLILIG